MTRALLLPTLTLLLACGRTNPGMELQTTNDSLAFAPSENTREFRKQEPGTPAVATPPPIERQIIRQGDISFQTDDAAKTRSEIRRTVAALGGQISGDNAYASTDRTEYRLDIRIPAQRFDSLLLRISEKAGHIESRNISAQDVTSEYIDVQARIRTQKQLEARYLELLKKASTVEEMLAIERELGTLRAEIESVEGRMKYLSDQVAMSSLTVTFYEKAASGFGFGHRFIDALGNGWKNIMAFSLSLVSLWPFLLIGTLAVWGFRKWRRKG
jgi:hypothetical protein